jgi:hypothetical protein
MMPVMSQESQESLREAREDPLLLGRTRQLKSAPSSRGYSRKPRRFKCHSSSLTSTLTRPAPWRFPRRSHLSPGLEQSRTRQRPPEHARDSQSPSKPVRAHHGPPESVRACRDFPVLARIRQSPVGAHQDPPVPETPKDQVMGSIRLIRYWLTVCFILDVDFGFSVFGDRFLARSRFLRRLRDSDIKRLAGYRCRFSSSMSGIVMLDKA